MNYVFFIFICVRIFQFNANYIRSSFQTMNQIKKIPGKEFLPNILAVDPPKIIFNCKSPMSKFFPKLDKKRRFLAFFSCNQVPPHLFSLARLSTMHDTFQRTILSDAPRCCTMQDVPRCAMLYDARCSTMRDALRCSAIYVDTMRDTLR